MNINKVSMTQEQREQALRIKEKSLKLVKEIETYILNTYQEPVLYDPKEIPMICLQEGLMSAMSKEGITSEKIQADPLSALPVKTMDMIYPLYIPFPNLNPLLSYLEEKEEIEPQNPFLKEHLDQMCMLRPMQIIETTLDGKLLTYLKAISKQLSSEKYLKIIEDLKEQHHYYEAPSVQKYELLMQLANTAREIFLSTEVNLPEALTADTEILNLQFLKMTYLIFERTEEQFMEMMEFMSNDMPPYDQDNPMETVKKLLSIRESLYPDLQEDSPIEEQNYSIPPILLEPLIIPTEQLLVNLAQTVSKRVNFRTLMSIPNPYPLLWK